MIIGTRQAVAVISRKMVISIGNGVLNDNNPNSLSKFGGHIKLTDDWARDVLKSMDWVKRKGTAGKVEPSKQFLEEEKFTFQRSISMVVYNHDIPPELIPNLDQTPLSYVSPGKYTFNIKGSSNVPIKGIDDKRQITATFAVSATGELLPILLIYEGKTKFKLPRSFNVTFTGSHWSNTQKAMEHFETVIFPYLNRIKENNGYPGGTNVFSNNGHIQRTR